MKMVTRKLTKAFCTVAAMIAFAACTNNKGDNSSALPSAVKSADVTTENQNPAAPTAEEPGAPAAPAPGGESAVTAPTEDSAAGLAPAGAVLERMDVAGFKTLGEGDQEIIHSDLAAQYPELASRSDFLATIDRVEKTDMGTLQLWSKGRLVLVLAHDNAGQLYILKSTNGFTADMITWTSSDSDQKDALSSLAFTISQCKMVEKQPEQQQGQEQEQQQDQKQVGHDKDKGKKVEEPTQEKVCAAVKAVIYLKAVASNEQQQQQQMPEEKKQMPEEKKQLPEEKKQLPEEKKQMPEEKKQMPNEGQQLPGGQQD